MEIRQRLRFLKSLEKMRDGKFIALKAIERLIEKCTSPYILLSYSNGGRATKEEICEIIETQCKAIQIFSIDYSRNVMSSFVELYGFFMRWTHNWIKEKEEKNTEFLFLMQKK